jgi:hypothetical protein
LPAVLRSAGFNICWLLRMVVKKGIGLFALATDQCFRATCSAMVSFKVCGSVKSGSMRLAAS